MNPFQTSITEWIATTRRAQDLPGIVSLDPALHARTLGAIDRATARKTSDEAVEASPAA